LFFPLKPKKGERFFGLFPPPENPKEKFVFFSHPHWIPGRGFFPKFFFFPSTPGGFYPKNDFFKWGNPGGGKRKKAHLFLGRLIGAEKKKKKKKGY